MPCCAHKASTAPPSPAARTATKLGYNKSVTLQGINRTDSFAQATDQVQWTSVGSKQNTGRWIYP